MDVTRQEAEIAGIDKGESMDVEINNDKGDKKLRRLQKHLATNMTEAVTLIGEPSDGSPQRKRLRSSIGSEADNPKIIMRISNGKVAEATVETDNAESSSDSQAKTDSVVSTPDKSRRSRSRKQSTSNELPTNRVRTRSQSRGRSTSSDRTFTLTNSLKEASLGPDGKQKPRRRGRPSNRKKSLEREDPSSSQDSQDAPAPLPKAKTFDDKTLCWVCFKPDTTVGCKTCPRRFHPKCAPVQEMCGECSAEVATDSASTVGSNLIKLEQFCQLLKFTLQRMKDVPRSQDFCKPVDPKEEPSYYQYITTPMDLQLLGDKIDKQMYGSTVAFFAEAKWILYNSIVYNSLHSPLSQTARQIIKVCRQELDEIDKCPDCYFNAHTKKDWFVQVCNKPHILIWARLKGFPFWPAKALTTNLKNQMVDARFFGAHDKAWIPVRDCYLLSTNTPPTGSKKKSSDMSYAFTELKEHLQNIEIKFGSFVHSADKVPYQPDIADKQLAAMIPGWSLANRTSAKTDRNPADRTVDVVQTGTKAAAAGSTVNKTDSGGGGRGQAEDDTSNECDDAVGLPKTPEHGYSISNTVHTEESKDVPLPKPSALSAPDSTNTAECVKEGVLSKNSARKPSQQPELAKLEAKKNKEVTKGANESNSSDVIITSANSSPAPPTNSNSARKKQTKDENASEVSSSEPTAELLPVEVKQENFQQYLNEENQDDDDDVQFESEFPRQRIAQPMVTIMDLKLLSRQKSGPSDAIKQKSPVQGNVRLSNEVSLMVVDPVNADKSSKAVVTVDADGNSQKSSPRKTSNKARKSIPRSTVQRENAVTISTSSTNEASNKGLNRHLNVISIDTKSSDAQRNLLKSLAGGEEKRAKKTTPSVVKESSPSQNKDASPGSSQSPQSVPASTSVTAATSLPVNGPVLISGNGQAYIANAPGQNLALAHNNGQFSLVQLTNMASSVNPGFVNLTNDALGIPNAYPTIISSSAPPPLSPFPGQTGNLILAPSSAASMPEPAASSATTSSVSGRTPLISVRAPSALYAPSTSQGPSDPVSIEVKRHADKTLEVIQDSLMSILRTIGEDLPEAKKKIVAAEKSRASWLHQKANEELKKNYERQIAELRTKLELDKQKALNDQRLELEKVVEETKKRQWCALCRKEALFYCCWNTSYCNYPCQQQHWLAHMQSCTQIGHPASPDSTLSAPLPKRKLTERNPSSLIRPGMSGNTAPVDGPSFHPNRLHAQQSSLPLTTNPMGLSTYSGPASKKKQ